MTHGPRLALNNQQAGLLNGESVEIMNDRCRLAFGERIK